MGRLVIERLLLLFLLVSRSGAETGGGESANVQSKTDNSQLRGLAWFGTDGQGSDTKDNTGTPAIVPSGPMIQLIESVPCEPDHEKARAVVSLFGKIESGNEACAAEADPDSCSGGCCRFGTHFLCDRNNAYPELPCVCNRNTAANHPHQGHLHTLMASVEEKVQEGALDISVAKERDGETSGEIQSNNIDNAGTDEKKDESDGLVASVVEFLRGNDEHQDGSAGSSAGGSIKSNAEVHTFNEAVFLTGWGGDPPEDQIDPGAVKHGMVPGDHKSNRDLIEDEYDYDHGPLNQATWLTPFAEGPTY